MSQIIEEVTKLYPVEVWEVLIPHTNEEVSEFLRRNTGKVSVWWGRYSMWWQTAVTGGTQIDMREMNRIVHFSKEEKTITVQAWIRWRDIQDYIDPYDLSVMTMQTYSNFTVGWALSVNCHGRYIGYWPIILSVISLTVALADGTLVSASPRENSDIFFGTIGGYGGIGVILEATLMLKDNTKLERTYQDMPITEYAKYFHEHIRDNQDIIFHNGDIYPPHYSQVRATSWEKTEKSPTPKERLISRNASYSLHQHVYAIMRSGHIGKWFRERIIDPLVYHAQPVHLRNYEASYDVAELEPKSREKNTYVLEEYFCPVDRFDEFVETMREIFVRHDVNVINISIRHALPDAGSYLAWAREEVFAFVVYYNQKTAIPERDEVAVWTRELIDAVIAVWGRYYLPYQLHGTLSQVKKAYPRWDEYTELKKKYDPTGKFSNMLFEKYYFSQQKEANILPSRFKTVYAAEIWRDKFYVFLQNIFHIAPTQLFHSLIWRITTDNPTDEEIYTCIQKELPTIRPLLADIRYGIPALRLQKREMAREARMLLWGRKIDGYLEIGWAGRYIGPMQRECGMWGWVYLISDEPIDYAPTRILERGRLWKYNTSPLTYSPNDLEHIPDNSLSLVSIFIGLHHCPEEGLDAFFSAIIKKLKPDGSMIIRDHNVCDEYMHTFVAIAHDIYNAGTGVSWDVNKRELRNFQSIESWKIFFERHGMHFAEKTLLQKNDPTENTLMLITKIW